MSKISKIIKVRVKKEYLNLNEILPLGYETELNMLVSEKDVIIPAKTVYITNKIGIIIAESMYLSEQIIPAGNSEGFNFKGVNNETYNHLTLINAIGFVPINQIFEKI